MPGGAAALAALLVLAAAPSGAGAAAGDLDQRFGTGGTIVAPLGAGDASATALAVTPSGGLVVAGEATVREPDESGAGSRQLFLARFGGLGDPGPLTFFPPQDPPADTGAAAAALLPDGRIAAAGSLLVAAEGRQAGLVTLHRPDTALDPSFGGRGWVTPGFDGGGAADVAVLDDGRLLVAGGAVVDGASRGELIRLRPDGSGDPAFGTSGLAARTAAGGAYERYDAVAPAAGGGAIVAGTADAGDGDQAFLVARFAADGSVAGVARTPFPGGAAAATALVTLPDGSAVAAGSAGGGADADWALAKYRPDGTLDPAFGGDGRVVLATSGFEDRLLAVAAGPRGTLVAAGLAGADGGARTEFVIARLTASGRLDPSFGDAGTVRVPLPGDIASANALAVLPDGGVVAAGSAQRDGRTVIALARLLGDGPAPPLATSDPPPPAGGEPDPVVVPPRARFSVKLLSRRVERGNTLRVRVRWPRGWRGAASIRITRVRRPQILIASRAIRGTGGRGRTFRVKLTRLGRDALLGVRRTRVRVELLPRVG